MAESQEILTTGEIECNIKKLLNISSDVKDNPSPNDNKGETNTQNCSQDTSSVEEKPPEETVKLEKFSKTSVSTEKNKAAEKYSYVIPEDMVEVISVDKKKKKKKKGNVQDKEDAGEDGIFYTCINLELHFHTVEHN